jgi:hypothetical protein
MKRTITVIVVAMLWTGATFAQSSKNLATNLREQLIGTWIFSVAEVTAPDGKKTFPFGEKPKGILVFTTDGHFVQFHAASDLPKLASNNRLTGTPEEYAAINRGSVSVYGTYAVDEANKTVTFNIISASFPNWNGEAQVRTIDKLSEDEFVNTNHNVAGGRGQASNFYTRVK